ncbi:LANO_0F13212g1_1 [Lachancea nothofagi CBS 11611]|uniref:LANO_0F13212g1_1 n=1 Tax=Lachancea nothofagi CBS 11611 TaxID=1266666 RepID=A0A1G4KBN6_9SACH|nr:LANO_0F13212g1_1 [Lachancea nothofagi CBS 11611]
MAFARKPRLPREPRPLRVPRPQRALFLPAHPIPSHPSLTTCMSGRATYLQNSHFSLCTTHVTFLSTCIYLSQPALPSCTSLPIPYPISINLPALRLLVLRRHTHAKTDRPNSSQIPFIHHQANASCLGFSDDILRKAHTHTHPKVKNSRSSLAACTRKQKHKPAWLHITEVVAAKNYRRSGAITPCNASLIHKQRLLSYTRL